MSREIDILLEAYRQGYLIVDKDSHVLFERDELAQAQAGGQYQEDAVLCQEGSIEVSSPFPGCLQLGAATEDDLDFRLLGQTPHFVIFIPAKRAVCGLGPLAK